MALHPDAQGLHAAFAAPANLPARGNVTLLLRRGAAFAPDVVIAADVLRNPRAQQPPPPPLMPPIVAPAQVSCRIARFTTSAAQGSPLQPGIVSYASPAASEG